MSRYNSPPNWPTPPEGWKPEPGWLPDAAWGAAPEGWEFWTREPGEAPAAPLGAPVVTKQNWFLRHKVLTGVGTVIVVFVAIGIASGGDGDKSAGANKPTPVIAASTSSSSSSSSSSSTSSATSAPAPKPTVAAAPKPAPPKLFLAVSARTLAKIIKSPDAHAGARLILWAEITQFDSATGDDSFRVNVGNTKKRPSYGFVDYSDNAMFTGNASALSDLVEGDLIEVRVIVTGSLSYDTQIGGSTTVPQFQVVRVKRYGSTKT